MNSALACSCNFPSPITYPPRTKEECKSPYNIKPNKKDLEIMAEREKIMLTKLKPCVCGGVLPYVDKNAIYEWSKDKEGKYYCKSQCKENYKRVHNNINQIYKDGRFERNNRVRFDEYCNPIPLEKSWWQMF